MEGASPAGLSAIQDRKPAFVPKVGQPINGTGAENVMYLQWQVKLLYPELFQDIDMHDVVKDFIIARNDRQSLCFTHSRVVCSASSELKPPVPCPAFSRR